MHGKLWLGIRIIGFKMGSFRGVLFLGLVSALAFNTPALAAKDFTAALAAKQVKQVALAKKAQRLDGEVSSLQLKLVDASQTLRQSKTSLHRTERKLKKLRDKKERYIAQIYEDESTLGGLVAAARKYSRTSVPNMLLQTSPLKSARASIVMRSIVPALEQQSTTLRQELARIEKIEQAIEGERHNKSKKIIKINGQNKKLQSLVQKRKKSYKRTEIARKVQERAIQKLAKEAKTLEELVAKIERKKKAQAKLAKVKKPSSYRLPSGIKQPVLGSVLTGFGEKNPLGAKSRGITFKAESGATIVTPLAGIVKFAGPFQKYRQILIIAHKDGYHSLIAGLDRIDTVVGASLTTGEPVGAAETGATTARVYYELRHNGTPVNPRKLIIAQRKQNRS